MYLDVRLYELKQSTKKAFISVKFTKFTHNW